MISATNTEGYDYDLGVDFLEYKEGEIYVSDVNRGPFYDTGRSDCGSSYFAFERNNVFLLIRLLGIARPNFLLKLTKPSTVEIRSLPSTEEKLQSIFAPLTRFSIFYTPNPK